jgi:hypothetical protein
VDDEGVKEAGVERVLEVGIEVEVETDDVDAVEYACEGVEKVAVVGDD